MYDPRYTFYTIDNRYLEYLRIYDSRVPRKNSRPYIGLVSKRGNLSVNPDYNYAHLEESMYQDMVDNIKKGEGKANQLITPNKSKDNDYER